MEKTNDVVKVLEKILGDRAFISSLMKDSKSFSGDEIQEKLGTVISYYIATRDTRTDYTYEEIEGKYSKIKNVSLESNPELYENVITHGFFTHSFNGYKRDRVMKYGLNYMDDISDEGTVTEIQNARDMIQKLEEMFGESKYVKTALEGRVKHVPNEVFITTPGTKTIHYACKNSPERLYLGPLKQEKGKEEPIVVGETKQTYMLRVLTKKIQQKYPDASSKEHIEALKLAREATEYFCSKPPAVAFLSTGQMKDMPVSIIAYQPDNSKKLEDWIKYQIESHKILVPNGQRRVKQSGEIISDYEAIFYSDDELELVLEEVETGPTTYFMGDFFSTKTRDENEPNNMGDIATLAQYIPDRAIVGIIDMVDEFEMKQIYAKSRGMKIGDLIDYNGCKYIGEPTVEQLLDAITPNCTEEDLIEIRRKYEKIIQSKTTEQKISDLEAKKQEILGKPYPKKEGASTEYTLSDVLAQFEQNGLMPSLLEQDETIQQDELQYQSKTHGIPHTRRVNFLAIAIMNMENITGRNREIILEIVKNHDIGRVHDWEDSQHGEGSVSKIDDDKSRLEGFSEEEQKLIKFVIAQHSRSTKENKQAISELPEELRQKYGMILDLFKDADKLDRVRLDPYGNYPREGLDVTRLSLESSKKLEGVAYESYSKLFEILDIERQKQVIREENMQEQQEKQTDEIDAEFERRMQIAQQAIIERQQNSQKQAEQGKEFLQSIIEKGKTQIGLKEMNQFITRMKSEILKILNPNRNGQQNGR